MAVFLYYKKYTETLGSMLERFRSEFPSNKETKLTYAGRLDPLAEGLIIILEGEDVHHKESYNLLPKTYQVTLVLGVSSDSYDVLGIPSLGNLKTPPTENEVQEVLSSLIGERARPYPPFSSKPVLGRPLFWWTKEHRLEEIEIPVRMTSVSSLNLLNYSTIDSLVFLDRVVKTVNSVEGDFRQPEIIAAWKELRTQVASPLISLTIQAEVSSGTYIRSLVHEIGETLGCGAVSLRIQRLRIGSFSIVSERPSDNN